MSFDFSGHVIQTPRSASTNAKTTAEANAGVVRAVSTLPVAYDLPAPTVLDVRADQYRTALLNAPGTTPVEYLIWAENTSNFAVGENWVFTQGEAVVSPGSLVVEDATPQVFDGAASLSSWGTFSDGSLHLVVRDSQNRSLHTVLYIVVARGDEDAYDDAGWVDDQNPSLGRRGGNPYVVIQPQASDFVSGVLTVSDNNIFSASPLGLDPGSVLGLLGGGLSRLRGDRVLEVRYTLSPPRVWWTRNDRYQTRFGWSGRNQRWQPYPGNPVQNLGVLNFDSQYMLSPKPRGLKIGFVLPEGMIRVGTDPGGLSVSPGGDFLGIGVRADAQVVSFDFSLEPDLSGVVGQSNGVLVFNPRFVENHSGKTVWYSNRDFDTEATGVLGDLRGTLYLAPIPRLEERPLLRVGSRQYLTPQAVSTDVDLSESADPAEHEVLVSLETGRLRFSSLLLNKADPESASFNKHFLGEKVVYDGISLSGLPQPVTPPCALVANGGKLYVPNAEILPSDFNGDSFVRGLGRAGVLDVPDNTGAVPTGVGQASVRPGGDSLVGATTGRVRQVGDGVGDLFVFSQRGVASVVVVDRESDLPSRHRIPKGVAYVSREHSDGLGSVLRLGRADTRRFGSGDVFFAQSNVIPATYTRQARLVSKTRFVFRFDYTESLYFSIDGVPYTWDAITLPTKDYHTPQEVVDSIQSVVGGGGEVYEDGGSVVIASSDPENTTSTVEIGWGGLSKDLSGAAKLGFLPGWRVVGGRDNWVVDSGLSFGLYRSPQNKLGNAAIPDLRAQDRVEDEVLQRSVTQSPLVFLQNPPLQDEAGYDEGVFFSLVTTVVNPDETLISTKVLNHYSDVLHDFSSHRFLWLSQETLSQELTQPTATISFGNAAVVPNSLLNAPGVGGGLLVSEGGSFSFQELGSDYILPQEGIPGNAILIERLGEEILAGGRGSFVGNVFTDPDGNFTAPSDEVVYDSEGNPLVEGGELVYHPVVREGYQLKVLSGDSAGSYVITSVAPNGTGLVVAPPFPSASIRATPWKIYRGYDRDVYDPGVVADQVYRNFNHLPEEPFRVRVLTRIGVAGGDLVADMQSSLALGRVISLRFGLDHSSQSNSASIQTLTSTRLGEISNGGLRIPGVGTDRFVEEAFLLKIGVDSFVPSVVPSFSDPVVGVEVRAADGVVRFADTLLEGYALAQVTYQETFLPAHLISGGTSEVNPYNGEVRISSVDIAQHVGKPVYLVEQQISENSRDVSLNPLAGTIGFQQPLKQGQVVEVAYHKADLEGRKEGSLIEEFLPVFLPKTEAARVNHFKFTFNAEGHTLDSRIAPTVYIGGMLQNFNSTDYVLDPVATVGGLQSLTFISKTIPSHVKVDVSYAVLEARGGERSYTVSTLPVYRPPFFLKAGVSSFGLQGDRTTEFIPGQVFRLGESCFYIKAVEYFPPRATPLEERNPLNPARPIVKAGNVTKIHIYPPTSREVGSRSPGHDVLCLLSGGPITSEVDGITTSAPLGFMQSLPLGEFPFEPVSAGQTTITFKGNLTTFAIPGHILEISGRPFTISASELNEVGSHTKITLTAPFEEGFSVESVSSVKLSYRPIYPPNASRFLGVGPIVSSEPTEVVIFENDNPGRTLLPNVDYTLDLNSGVLEFLGQPPLLPDQQIFLRFTRLRTLSPTMQDGVPVTPRVFGSYLFNVTPTRENGILGGTLQATYSFRNPDTFYVRIPTLATFLGETLQEVIQEVQAQQTGQGSFKLVQTGEDNWKQGNTGLYWEKSHLANKDRAARTYLDFFNTTVQAFEQINETISGGFVGDRDGKFSFWVGRDAEWPTPGYEDEISGELLPQNLWSLVFNEGNPTLDLILQETDPLVNPLTAGLVGGVLTGEFPETDQLGAMISRQKELSLNDIDDRVLISRKRFTIKFLPVSPYFTVQAKGNYKRMGSAHTQSRLFPTQTKGFFLTYPGLEADENTGDAGFYSWGRVSSGKRRSTSGQEIALVSNPVLGQIQNITGALFAKRRARSRVWGYFEDGIPADAFGVGVPAAPITEPCLLATPLSLRDVPVSPETGFLDTTKFRSQGGELADLEVGDPELAVPGFVSGDQLSWGQPDGNVYPGFHQQNVSVFGRPTLGSLHVFDVQYGCVIRFADPEGNLLGDKNTVLVGNSEVTGAPAHLFPIKQGDTLFVTTPLGGTEVSDPPTREELRQAASSLDVYRNGFDINIRPDGRVLDVTFPSVEDPYFFGLKEMLAQNPPAPLSAMEGPVDFLYLDQLPLEIPALRGEDKNDSGDYTIPYLRTENTELDRLGDVNFTANLVRVFASNGGDYVYPDEVVGRDGEIIDTSVNFDDVGVPFGATTKEPATLMSQVDPFPVGVGQGPLQAYDLLLVEVGQGGIEAGAQGFLSIGSVREPAPGVAFIEPPRFVTPTTAPLIPGGVTGSPVRYEVTNAIVHVDGYVGNTPQVDNPSGVRLYERDSDGDSLLDVTVLDFSDLGQLALNNGLAVATGNFNDIWDVLGAKANNKITIHVFARNDNNITDTPGALPLPAAGRELLQIRIQGTQVEIEELITNSITVGVVGAGDVEFGTTEPVPLGVILSNKQIVIRQIGILGGHWPSPGLPENWFLPYVETNLGLPGHRRETMYGYDFSFDVDTYNGAAPRGESETAYINTDRLTFHEVIDFRLARPRGYTHPQSVLTSLETTLRVREVTVAPNTASNINDVNGGVAFTFVPRSAANVLANLAGGTWAAQVGSLKVMAFEGPGNAVVSGAGVHFSGIPSSRVTPTANPICVGEGVLESSANVDSGNPRDTDNRISRLSLSGGSLSNVEAGDILVVTGSGDPTHHASTKVGTYLVKHAVTETDAVTHTHQATLGCIVGGGTGWINQRFPQVQNFDADTGVVDLTNTLGFVALDRAYIILSTSRLADPDVSVFRVALVSGTIQVITPTSLTLNDFRWADGSVLAVDEVRALQLENCLVSGQATLTISVNGGTLPNSSSIVGHHDPLGTLGDAVIYGFRYVNFVGPLNPASPLLLDSMVIGDISVSGGGGKLEVDIATPIDNTLFNANPNPVVYDLVPGSIDISGIPNDDWRLLNDQHGHTGVGTAWVACLMPNTQAVLEDPGAPAPGFWAQAGVFLEPSFPTPVVTVGVSPNVVERLAPAFLSIGSRDFSTYNVSGAPVATYEPVAFEVRRIRRFHQLGTDISEGFAPLRYAYEIRRGRITGYVSTDKQFGLVTSDGFSMTWNQDNPGSPVAQDVWNTGETDLQGTNLGGYFDRNVNVNVGDEFRLLDSEGEVLEIVQIVGITQNNEIKLQSPGITTRTPLELAAGGGMRYEIFLRQAPVPHEQSNEQLLSLLTFREVHKTTADYATETGGYVEQGVYDDTVNIMFDDENPGTWAAKGVMRGDIVIVDPTPRIPATGERGFRPLGDVGAYISGGPQRGGYQPGEPGHLDDNRGFYRVVDLDDTQNPPALMVSGESDFAGIRSGGVTTDVIFPEDVAYVPILGYAVMPTVSGSSLTPDSREGQADLRPTKKRELIGGVETYAGDTFSIRPFSYRIIRPSGLFSTQAIDLILTNRERTLSWIDELRSVMAGRKGGQYWVFQRDLHAHDVGDPQDPQDGLGVLRNLTIESLLGEVGVSPYLNTSDALSILDRRFWIFDRRLDSLVPETAFGMRTFVGGDPVFPDPGGPYTAYTDEVVGETVRPTLPERVDALLDTEDQFRLSRYAWLAYRTHMISGTLPRLDLLEQEFPKRLKEAEKAALLRDS